MREICKAKVNEYSNDKTSTRGKQNRKHMAGRELRYIMKHSGWLSCLTFREQRKNRCRRCMRMSMRSWDRVLELMSVETFNT